MDIKYHVEDRYKTTFVVPMGQYEWIAMPFGSKNAPTEIHKRMDDIFKPFVKFLLVYIDDVIVLRKGWSTHKTSREII